MNIHTVLHQPVSQTDVDATIRAARNAIETAIGKALAFIAKRTRDANPDVLAVRITARYSEGSKDIVLNSWDIDLCTNGHDETVGLWNDRLRLVDTTFSPLESLSELIDELSTLLEPLWDGEVLIAPTYAPVYFHTQRDFLEWIAINPPTISVQGD